VVDAEHDAHAAHIESTTAVVADLIQFIKGVELRYSPKHGIAL
jgi:hypothetical protein